MTLRSASLVWLAGPAVVAVAFTSGMKTVPPKANSVPFDLANRAGLVSAFSEPKKAAVPVPPSARACAPRPIRLSPLVANAEVAMPDAAKATKSLLSFILSPSWDLQFSMS